MMKTLCLWLVSFLILITFASALPKICLHNGRQMTPGQTEINCYKKITCMSDGLLKKEPSCPRYSCFPKSKATGYKKFDPTEPYPHCCGGEICEDKYKIIYKL